MSFDGASRNCVGGSLIIHSICFHLLPSAHGHAAHVLFLLMVIRLVAHGDLLLTDLLAQFAVRSVAAQRAGRNGVVLKDPAHVVEQFGGREEYIGTVIIIEVVQKELGVLISLGCGFPEPAMRLLPVLGHILAGEVQLAQGVLRILVALLGGIGQILHRSGCIFRDILSLQIQFPQPVGGPEIALRRCFLIPGHRFLHLLFTLQQFTKSVL